VELPKSIENGLHERKGAELVILEKKLEHDKLEKFCAMLPSNG
jgi:hypothetical protein